MFNKLLTALAEGEARTVDRLARIEGKLDTLLRAVGLGEKPAAATPPVDPAEETTRTRKARP